jgi:hypothetical protein
VILALDRSGNLNDVLHNVFDNLLDRIGHVDLAELFDGHLYILGVHDRNVIRHFDAFLDEFLDRIRSRMVHIANDFIWHAHLVGHWSGHGGGYVNVSVNNLLHDLLDGVGHRPVDESLDWNGDVDGHTDVDRPRYLDYFFHELLHRIRHLSLSDVFHWVGNPLLDDLFDRDGDLDWHWNGHSSWNSCVPLYNLLHRDWDRPVDEFLIRNWNIAMTDSFDGNAYGSLYELFHRVWNVNAVRNRDVVGLRIWSVDHPGNRIRNRPREGFLNGNRNGMIDISIDRIRDWNARWYVIGVCHVHPGLDISIDRNGDLGVNIPLYRNRFRPLHQQCLSSPRKKRHRKI